MLYALLFENQLIASQIAKSLTLLFEPKYPTLHIKFDKIELKGIGSRMMESSKQILAMLRENLKKLSTACSFAGKSCIV